MQADKVKNILILGLGGLVVFLAGMQFNTIQSQGAGGRRAPTPRQKPADPAETQKENLSSRRGSFSSGAAGGMIAVTGDYGVGTSVLYIIDTKSGNLSVYEAKGGSKSSRKLVWVGARQIDLDLKTQSYNDESEVSYSQLRDIFKKKGMAPDGSGTR